MTTQVTFKSMFRWIVPVIALLLLATVLILATPMLGTAHPLPAQQHSSAPAPESSPRAGGGCHAGC